MTDCSPSTEVDPLPPHPDTPQDATLDNPPPAPPVPLDTAATQDTGQEAIPPPQVPNNSPSQAPTMQGTLPSSAMPVSMPPEMTSGVATGPRMLLPTSDTLARSAPSPSFTAKLTGLLNGWLSASWHGTRNLLMRVRRQRPPPQNKEQVAEKTSIRDRLKNGVNRIRGVSTSLLPSNSRDVSERVPAEGQARTEMV
ncbi:hypothetical protein KIPB_005414 [Kipferlia bialata]|uniref:Uncharacterized protein n=1 Tax=Kipferlia bialata TaxID=797122 RepID=A0A9K3CW05_9EUKA|nr:hypothetical protein KIPB_005414 [Kipferlia bialata]|eukprot:g5414.t1